MTTHLRLLIVEDSADDALLLERELIRNGYDLECRRVDTPEAMQDALAAKEWDLVISDFVMPRFSGLDALQLLNTSGIDIPFIVVSGKIGEEIAVEAMRSGANDYILKGNLARLVPVIEREMVDAEVRRKRRQAERELQESEERYQLAAEEHHKMEQQFQQTQKLESLGVLAGGIAHDFNNILTIILGHCGLARVDSYNGRPIEVHLAQIETAAHRAADLCRQMLTYAGKSPLVQTQVNMWLLIDETVKMLQSVIKKNVIIELALKRDVPEIIGDTAQIQQVIMNLIINAAEAIGDGSGTIKVVLVKNVVETKPCWFDYLDKAIPPGVYACVEVSDNGCGMDDATKMRIFEPFFTTKFTGRGLGMSAILGIIKSHAGALQLSTMPAVGTTFRVYFPVPVVPAVVEAVALNGTLLSGITSGTILLVDDEELLCAIGSSLLSTWGFTVITAPNGRKALEIYKKRGGSIDLILLDLVMPEMGGLEAYHELRKKTVTLPIVICSGYSVEEVADAISNDLYAAFLHKPYKPHELKAVLIKLLGKSQRCPV